MNIIENVLKQRLNRDITEIILTNIWRLKFDKIVDEIGKIEHRYNDGNYIFHDYNHIIEIKYTNYVKRFTYSLCVGKKYNSEICYYSTYLQQFRNNNFVINYKIIEIRTYNFYDNENRYKILCFTDLFNKNTKLFNVDNEIIDKHIYIYKNGYKNVYIKNLTLLLLIITLLLHLLFLFKFLLENLFKYI
jgi:hypothetical protein